MRSVRRRDPHRSHDPFGESLHAHLRSDDGARSARARTVADEHQHDDSGHHDRSHVDRSNIDSDGNDNDRDDDRACAGSARTAPATPDGRRS
jgi:hypothetical protein